VSFPVRVVSYSEVAVPLVMTREDVLAVYAQGPAAVVTLVLALVEQVSALEARVATLEAERAKDSHNSGKPPSTDASRAGRAPKSLRGRSGKSPGGQPGHPGRTLALRAAPDVVLTHAPAACRACGLAFAASTPTWWVPGARRQVFEVPPVALTCTEHRMAECVCAGCGATTRGAYPAVARSTVQYGPGVLALGVYLTAQHLLPVARAAEVLRALVGQRVSPATLAAAEARGATALAPVTARVRAGLAASPVLHLDETGFFVNTARWWLHVVCTPTLTHYAAHPKRGTAAHAAVGLLPGYAGTAVHDGYASYFTHAGCRHALCGVHLLRELTGLAEPQPAGQPGAHWAAAFARALLVMKRAADRARAAGTAALPAATRARYRRRYEALLAAGEAAEPPPEARRPGWKPRRTPGAQLLYRLRRDQDAVLRFLVDLRVPFDNSEAERDLRMMKVEQKVSGGFRTAAGAHTFCALRGYLSTARKQGQDALGVLRDLLAGHPFIPAVP